MRRRDLLPMCLGRMDDSMPRALRAIAAVLSISSLIGCVTGTQYPAGWPPTEQAMRGSCPLIEGRYENVGQTARPCERWHIHYAYDWYCESDLTSNILAWRTPGIIQGHGWVAIKQPDDNTLVITAEDGTAPITLKRDQGDFSCDSDGVDISRTGSGLRNASQSDAQAIGLTTLEAGLGNWSIARLSRHFLRADDGSLVMRVSESTVITFLYVVPAFGGRHDNFVRWPAFVANGQDEPAVR